jgi:hypothetical protein
MITNPMAQQLPSTIYWLLISFVGQDTNQKELILRTTIIHLGAQKVKGGTLCGHNRKSQLQ